jgi:hypothetical protein
MYAGAYFLCGNVLLILLFSFCAQNATPLPVHQVFHANQTGVRVVPSCCRRYSRVSAVVRRCSLKMRGLRSSARAALPWQENLCTCVYSFCLGSWTLHHSVRTRHVSCTACTPVGSTICPIALSLCQTCMCFAPYFSPATAFFHLARRPHHALHPESALCAPCIALLDIII